MVSRIDGLCEGLPGSIRKAGPGLPSSGTGGLAGNITSARLGITGTNGSIEGSVSSPRAGTRRLPAPSGCSGAESSAGGVRRPLRLPNGGSGTFS